MFEREQSAAPAAHAHALGFLDTYTIYRIISKAQRELFGREKSHGRSDVSWQLPSHHRHARAVLDTGGLYTGSPHAVPTRVTNERA